MKRLICAVLAIACIVSLFAGCTGAFEKSPDEYEGVRWISPDYKMRFTPDDDCKGTYTFNDKKYNVQFEFDSTTVNVYDTDKDDALMFYGDWMYEKDGDELYIYNITFDRENFKEMKKNLMGTITLRKEELEKKK